MALATLRLETQEVGFSFTRASSDHPELMSPDGFGGYVHALQPPDRQRGVDLEPDGELVRPGTIPEAVDAYDAYIHDGFFDLPLFVMHIPAPVVHEKLGRLYETAGNMAKAVEHYREFARRWAGSDPDLQLRVAAAQERITALGG
jgi:hypothetical protein